VTPTGFSQVRKDDGYEQKGLESFAQNDDERLKHNPKLDRLGKLRPPLTADSQYALN
jgi:hypothetical protein